MSGRLRNGDTAISGAMSESYSGAGRQGVIPGSHYFTGNPGPYLSRRASEQITE